MGYALICIIWGSTWLAIRVGLDSLTPFLSAGLRFLLAAVFIFLMMKLRNVELQTDTLAIRLYLIMGVFSFAIPFALVYWAEQFIASGLASILFGIFPFMVIIFSRLLIPGEVIAPLTFIGVLLCFIGIYAIFSNDISLNIGEDFWGMAAILLSATMQAVIAVVMKKYGRHLNPLSMNLVPVFIGGVLLIPVGLLFEDISSNILDWKAVSSVTYLAFFGTLITFTTYYWLLKRISVVILSLSSFITPIIAVILGWIILNEEFSDSDLIGSALVLIGILFANFRGLLKYIKSKYKLA